MKVSFSRALNMTKISRDTSLSHHLFLFFVARLFLSFSSIQQQYNFSLLFRLVSFSLFFFTDSMPLRALGLSSEAANLRPFTQPIHQWSPEPSIGSDCRPPPPKKKVCDMETNGKTKKKMDKENNFCGTQSKNKEGRVVMGRCKRERKREKNKFRYIYIYRRAPLR